MAIASPKGITLGAEYHASKCGSPRLNRSIAAYRRDRFQGYFCRASRKAPRRFMTHFRHRILSIAAAQK